MCTSEEATPARCKWPLRVQIKQIVNDNQIKTKEMMMKAIYCMIFVEDVNLPESSV